MHNREQEPVAKHYDIKEANSLWKTTTQEKKKKEKKW